MLSPSKEAYQTAKCTPCEGGTLPLDEEKITAGMQILDGWSLANDGKSIARKWNCKNFLLAMDRANAVAELAEAEQHHPDLHITDYRLLEIVLTTHAIGGLSENDFILAAKIDSII